MQYTNAKYKSIYYWVGKRVIWDYSGVSKLKITDNCGHRDQNVDIEIANDDIVMDFPIKTTIY